MTSYDMNQLAALRSGAAHWNKWREINRLAKPNLCGAPLSRADLLDADLFDADLRSADLRGANLFAANLSGADLGGADLFATNLSRAKLTNVNFHNAILFLTQFANVDLSTSWGLDNCQHDGPCSFDILTLQNSRDVPISFWRGCGLPEPLIDALPRLLNETIQFYSCFISYSHADSAFAWRLHDDMQRVGISCWLDEKQILPGDDIGKQIDAAVQLWDKVILCCSKASLNSVWVNRELEKAIQKEAKLWKERGKETPVLIPVSLDDTLFEWNGHWASELTRRHAADFAGWETDSAKYEECLNRVVRALRVDDSARETPPASKL